MSIEINRIKWKCRRGMRELDLLLREFAAKNLEKLDETNIKILDEVLDYDDQSLFDYIFKNISLSNYEHEDFIDKFLKKFSTMGNF
ncbi:MAG: succinate dehydrogenase assembly factor 2 [Gammaproteobacteria bacterium]